MTPTPATEKHYTPQELAVLWGVSPATIRRRFEQEPGVLKFGADESRYKRKYKTIRIPESVVERVWKDQSR